jgi:hypothetical protein
MTEITLKNLPKISLNKWYAGRHWTERSAMKDTYSYIIFSQIKNLSFTKEKKYHVEYSFFFKSHPLDASNCGSMIKLIEDIIFDRDGFKVVKKITVESNKGKEDLVNIKIHELH